MKKSLKILVVIICIVSITFYFKGTKIPNSIKETTVKLHLDYPSPEKVTEDEEVIQNIYEILDECKYKYTIPTTKDGGWHLVAYDENDKVLFTLTSDTLYINGMYYHVSKNVNKQLVEAFETN